jgi:antitoxin (DNA-binding transcriptional repressor) of toxin-antitoxin stability system
MAEADPQKTFNVDDVNTDLSELAARAHAGEEIVLAKAGVPYAKLVPYPDEAIPTGEALPPRQPGRFKDLLKDVPSDIWFERMSEEELDLWEGKNDPLC